MNDKLWLEQCLRDLSEAIRHIYRSHHFCEDVEVKLKLIELINLSQSIERELNENSDYKYHL